MSMFDGWLRATLQQRFDPALDEPLSDTLQAILAEQPDRRDDR